ncbi:MAG: hypothetical protein A3G24_07470 [Betaproteobacteria bacterium RIFCSPLOWO2_12_FULL_62_13]|nr:MAG: hypothetical protein A3G24_07470 [Betaproteobacteria bacterium RIFCSPLOWO2_12_FULL_62_13]
MSAPSRKVTCSRREAASVCVAVAALSAAPAGAASSDPRVIELTQLPCQFLESENGIDRKYVSRSIKDCEAINAKTGTQRVAQAKPLRLQPGKYLFRVTNRKVPYELGFWLRGASAVGRVTLPSVSGGGLMPGKTQDYEIELKPGEYVYSCPLNTTPDYKLVVK